MCVITATLTQRRPVYLRVCRGETRDHAICLIYRGKATNHLVTTNDDGEMTVNKKPWGHVRSLQAVVNVLQQPQQGW